MASWHFFFNWISRFLWSGAWVFRKETLGIDRCWHYILTRLVLAKHTFPKGLPSECKSSSLSELLLPKFFPNSRSRIQQSHLWILVLLFTGFTVLFLEPIDKSLEVWLQLLNLGFLLLAKLPTPNQKKTSARHGWDSPNQSIFQKFHGPNSLLDFWHLTKILRNPNSTRVGLITFSAPWSWYRACRCQEPWTHPASSSSLHHKDPWGFLSRPGVGCYPVFLLLYVLLVRVNFWTQKSIVNNLACLT